MIQDIPLPQLQFNWRKHVWKLQTLLKIESFLWKALVGALLVEIFLLQRGINVDALCKCFGAPESLTHVLRDCPFSIKVWNITSLSGSVSRKGDLFSFFSVLKSLKPLSQEAIMMPALYAWVLWNLWIARNHLMFTANLFSEEEIVRKFISEAKQWQITQSLQPCQVTSPLEDHRNHDFVSGFVCNVDGAWNDVSLNCGMGWIIISDENSPVFTS